MLATNPPLQRVGGRYQLLERLGAGGMGVVYRALDRLTGTHVALKRVIVGGNEPGDVDTRLALAQEFQTLASLRHPHIISVLDYGFNAVGQPFFTMDLLRNPHTITAAALDQPLSRKIEYLVQTLQALAYLHRRGILHRDLKPGNVLVADGQVRVLDFGLSQEITPEHGVVGTPAYMAPEVLRGEGSSAAADLYAVGVMAYELFVGRHPFNTSNISQLISEVINTPPDLTRLATALGEMRAASAPPPIPPELNGSPPTGGHDRTIGPGLSPDVDDTTRLHITPDSDKTTQLNLGAAPTRPRPQAKPSRLAPATGEVGFDDPLVSLIQRLLHKDPRQRYTDAITVIHDLSTATGQPLPVETAATRESFLQAARFVGREREMGQLLAAQDEMIRGQGSAWLIGGESGVGKSRLINELRTRALVAGALVLRGGAVSEAGAPFQVWREPLRRLCLSTELNDSDAGVLKPIVPDIDDLIGRPVPPAPELDPEQSRRRLFAVIASLFHRQDGPIMLVLEDMHWSGDESNAALSHLCESVRRLPLLIIASYRDDETPNLPESLPGMHVLRLERLDPESIQALTESMLGEAARAPNVIGLLQRETEGNVFFLVEVVRALAEEAGQLDRIGVMTLPAHVFTGGVRRIVQRRLGRVPSWARPLLELAAVLGRELDTAVLSAAAPDEDVPAWVSACAEAAVFDVQDERWQFAHDKLREGVLEALAPALRPGLHERAARAIEVVAERTHTLAPAQIAALAYHWGMAGDVEREAHYTILAGEQADRVSAYQEAIAHFKRALALLPPDEGARRAALTEKLGRVYARLNRHDEALRLLNESLTLAGAAGDRAVAARALACLGNVARARGMPADAIARYNDSLAASRVIGDRRTEAEALRGLAHVTASQGQYAEAVARFEEGLAVSREIDDQWGVAHALVDLGRLDSLQGDHARAADHMQEGLSIFRAIGDRRGMASALLNLGTTALYRGEPDEAVEHWQASLAISREIGDRWTAAATLNNLGYTALSRHDHRRAGVYLEEGLTLFREIGDRAAIAQTLINLGHVACALDQTPAARERYAEALGTAVELNAAPMILEILAGVACLRAQEGAAEPALELIGLALHHPGTNSDIKALAEPLLATLRDRLPSEVVESALARGRASDLQTTAAEMLTLLTAPAAR